MSYLPLPCPFHEACGGYINLHPQLQVEHEYQVVHGYECTTNITVTCELIAECTSCNFVELVEHDRRCMTFDQFYHPAGFEPASPFDDHLAEMELAGQLMNGGAYVE